MTIWPEQIIKPDIRGVKYYGWLGLLPTRSGMGWMGHLPRSEMGWMGRFIEVEWMTGR